VNIDIFRIRKQIKESHFMKPTRIVLLLAAVILVVTAWEPDTHSAAVVAQAQDSQAPPTLASTLGRDICAVEKQIVEVAEAMPEDQYNFSPESLNIPGADFKGVRTFAVQVKHVALPTISSGLRLPATSGKFDSIPAK
jgi:hypothetical protein